MSKKDISVEAAIRTLRNIVAPPRSMKTEEESDDEEGYFQGLREGIKRNNKDGKNKNKRKPAKSNTGSKNKNGKKSGSQLIAKRASISKYGSGDLFGTRGSYEKSLLYRSRLGGIPNTYEKPKNIANTAIFASKRRTSILPSEMGLGGNREESWKAIFRVKEEAGRRDLESKRDCTSAINTWAANFELHPSLLEFGIVEAITSMITNNEDDEVLENCIETIFILSTNKNILHELNRQKLYTTAMSMLLQAEELDLLSGMVNCSSVLLNLSNDIDICDKFISSGIVIELNRINSMHPRLETQFLQVIFNIVNTLDRTTHWMHDVLYYVLTLLKKHTISQENFSLIMKIMSRSSVLLEIPQHLCEKDITGILRQVVERMKKWKQEYAIDILRYTATTAFFISLSIEASTKMVDAGGLPLLRELLNIVHDDDAIICVCVATLGNMARSRLVRNKLVQDGAVKLLAVEAERCALQLQQVQSGVDSGEPTFNYEKLLAMCVAALATLAQDDESAIQVAIQGGMRLMIIVATYAKAIPLRSQAIVALCNLLSSKDTHILIESVGDQVQSSINIFELYHKQILASDISLAGYFATVFNNMTLSADGRAIIKKIDLATIVLWVALMAEGDDDAIELCLSCIYNCTLDAELLVTFQNIKHIGSIIDIMKISKGTRVDELCIATLHKLADGFQNAGAIFASQGAMDEIIDLTCSLAPRTRELAVTTLSQMTLDDNNIEVLVEDGAIRALAAVAKTSDELAQRATAALSNIAGHKHGMYIKQLLSAGAVETMIKLSGSKDPEVRRLSAHTICHLVSCAEGPRKEMIAAGAVNALVLTGLIRSSEEDIITRKACCCAMYTLCSTGDIDKLGDWRVVWSATCMMNLGLDFCIMALTILANLSTYPNGRHLISNKQTVEELVSFATSRSKIKIPVDAMKIIALVFHNTLCGFGRPKKKIYKSINTKTYSDFEVEVEIEREHDTFIDNNNYDGRINDSTNTTIPVVDLSNLNTLFQGKEGKEHRSACRIIAKSKGTKALTSLARLPFPRSKEQCAAALAILCTTDDTHEQFLNEGGFKILNEISHLDKLDVGTKVCWQIRQYCLSCAVYAALRPGSRFKAVRDGALEMIVPIVESSRSDETDELCCRCVELFAQDVSARALMIDSGVTQAMDNLTNDKSLPHKVFINRVKRFAKTLLYVCSVDLEERNSLVDYGVIELMSRFAQIPSERIAAEVIESLSLLCECEDRLEAIIHDGGLKVVQDVLSIGLKGEFGTHSHEIFERCAFIVGNFGTNEGSLLFLAENDIIPTVRFVSKTASSDSVEVCTKLVAGLCLKQNPRNRLIEKGHYRDILIMYNRLVQQPGHEHEAALLALSLLNMTKTEDKIAQREIVNGCEASALLINAQKVTDDDRDKLYDLLPHLPPSDEIFTNDGDEDEMVVPLFYSPAQKVQWPVYNFFTTPKVPEPADLKSKPTIAPRWIPRSRPSFSKIEKQANDSGTDDVKQQPTGIGENRLNMDLPETNISSVPPRINIKNSLTSPFYDKGFLPYDMCNLELYVDEENLDVQTKKYKIEILDYNTEGKTRKPRHSSEAGNVQAKKSNKRIENRPENTKFIGIDNTSTFISGVDANDAPQAYVESLMEVVVDRLSEEPERMFTIATKEKTNIESKSSAKADGKNNALELLQSVNNDNSNNLRENKRRKGGIEKSNRYQFEMPGIPRPWASPKSPVELRNLTKSLGVCRQTQNDSRKAEAKKFVEMMRKQTLASAAKDKRKLVVKLASTLQEIENERRAKTTPKRRRNRRKDGSTTLPDIPGTNNSTINSPKQSYSRIKVSKSRE